jgi:tetratricopeptide (TPR) repeat protein
VQKLLVTRVLEHLDRMATDAGGDRLTQLDLIDAYTRLGNIQGNPYDQNLGDTEGALGTIDKAIVLATPLAAAKSTDREALHALALAEECRSEILFGAAKTEDAVVSMRAAVATYDRLVAAPDTTPSLLGDAAAAYGTLGDELGQSGTASLADPAAALAAFRTNLALDERALAIDPQFLRAKRGLAITQLKIGTVELEGDPARALNDFQIALQRADALPKAELSSLATVRLRVMLLRKEADAMVELGDFEHAFPLFDQAIAIHQKLVAADPQDSRSLFDLQVVLNDEAVGYQEAANPVLSSSGDPRRNLAAAANLWAQCISIMQKMLKEDPTNDNWKSVLADAQVQLAMARITLKEQGDPAAIAESGLAALKEMAKSDQAPAMILDQTANAFLEAQPTSLRDPAFATVCAERAVKQSHRKKPSEPLTLAKAYRATGQIEKSRATANEGLALLPAQQPGAVKPDIRKLLEVQASAK